MTMKLFYNQFFFSPNNYKSIFHFSSLSKESIKKLQSKL